MARSTRKPFLPLILVFVFLNSFFILGKSLLERGGFDQSVLLIGNVILFVVTLLSYGLAQRGLQDKNPNAFVRSVYSSIMMKLFLCLIGAFIYIAIYQKNLNKPAFFTLMALYLVYTFVEVSVLTRQLRGRSAQTTGPAS